MEFRWVTDTNEQLVVKYGTSTSYGSQVSSDTVSGTGGSNNHAKISGLPANTKYFYQITTSGGTALTPAGDQNHYFQTAPLVGSSTSISFAAWGDSGVNNSSQDAVAKGVFARKPNLVFIAGDIAYPYSTDFNNNNTKHFNHYSDKTSGQNTMSFAPFYVTCGNHETSCPTVMADHSLPGGGNMGNNISTYSFDYGNVHFVALNSNGSYSYPSDPQMSWALNDLRNSRQPWKVIFWHHNGWSHGSHSTDSTRQAQIGNLARDGGAQLVFWGHSHSYERWNRTNGSSYTNPWPNTQFITVGDGGNTHSTSCTASGSSSDPGCAKGDTGPGYILAQVNGNQMTVQYYQGSSSSPLDSVTLNSSGGGPTSPPVTVPPATNTPTRPPNATSTPTRAPNATNTPVPTSPPNPTSPPGNALVRIESGGSSFADSAGNNWEADRDFSGGTVVDRGAISIANTNDDRIYQTERYGAFLYNIALPNGSYTVRLHFAETSGRITGSGQRVFSVDVEGQRMGNIDVFDEAGGKNIALIKSVDVTVSDGSLTIDMIPSIENPEINGIEILPLGGGGGTAGNGDANCDGVVDNADFVVWLNSYLNAATGCPNDSDFDDNGIVDGTDFSIWYANYGNLVVEASPTSTSFPNSPTPTRASTATFTPGATFTQGPQPTGVSGDFPCGKYPNANAGCMNVSYQSWFDNVAATDETMSVNYTPRLLHQHYECAIPSARENGQYLRRGMKFVCSFVRYNSIIPYSSSNSAWYRTQNQGDTYEQFTLNMPPCQGSKYEGKQCVTENIHTVRDSDMSQATEIRSTPNAEFVGMGGQRHFLSTNWQTAIGYRSTSELTARYWIGECGEYQRTIMKSSDKFFRGNEAIPTVSGTVSVPFETNGGCGDRFKTFVFLDPSQHVRVAGTQTGTTLMEVNAHFNGNFNWDTTKTTNGVHTVLFINMEGKSNYVSASGVALKFNVQN